MGERLRPDPIMERRLKLPYPVQGYLSLREALKRPGLSEAAHQEYRERASAAFSTLTNDEFVQLVAFGEFQQDQIKRGLGVVRK